MDQSEQLSILISEIYDAALDASLWRGVIGKASRFVGGVSAAIFHKDAAGRSGNVYYDDGGIDEAFRKLYFQKYGKLDPATTGHFFAELEQPLAVADLMPYDEFLETRFYKEWARPQGLVDFMAAMLDRSATSAAYFGVFRHERDGIADDEARRRMRLIVPHIRRAVLVGKLVDLKKAEVATLAETLDGLSAGMCLVDADSRVVHANAAAHVIFSWHDFMFVSAGRLAVGDTAVAHILRELFASAGDGDSAVGIKGIALPLTAQNGDRYVANVLPLTSGARRRSGIVSTAVAALFIHKSSLAMQPPPQIIAQHYKLTPTELRVLLAIVEVGGVPEVADALGIADSTVKTHLGRLFEKTGTRRQADLVKVVAGFSTPLLG